MTTPKRNNLNVLLCHTNAVLDSVRITGEILRRHRDGGWPERPAALAGTIELDSIGLSLPLAQLYARSGLSA